MKFKKIILIIIFLVGVTVLVYPFISQYYNSLVQSKSILSYEEKIKDIDYEKIYEEIEEYNNKLLSLRFPLIQYDTTNYYGLFDISDGMIGYITIDKIQVILPIYLTTDESVLNIAVGHLEGSSLPIGGDNTHSVLSAHSGLPSSKLFTNLNRLELGDLFEIKVLDKILTYQVDNIEIVLPNEVSSLEIVKDKDYVTLMTCTPYAVNTHRLLVRGTRVDGVLKDVLVITNEAYYIDKLIVTLFIAVPLFVILITYVLLKPKRIRGVL